MFSPHKEQLYHSQDESEGSYSFVTKEAGRFRFCFSNNKATSSDKVVSFEVASGTDLKVRRVSPPPPLFSPDTTLLGCCRSSRPFYTSGAWGVAAF